MRGCTSGLAGGCSNPKLAGLGERGTETWVLGERLIDTPWGFDCRDEGSAETAGVEDGSETRTHSTPVSAAGTARRRYRLGPVNPGLKREAWATQYFSRQVIRGRVFLPCSSIAVHWGSASPACSRTRYSAYQSGQSGSALPMRFSCWPWAASARRSAAARSFAEPNEVAAGSMRPGSRVVTYCNSHPLPSGSLNVAKER